MRAVRLAFEADGDELAALRGALLAARATELAEARRRGFTVEREEFDEDFCCIAAPVRDVRGRFLAVVGISMTRRAFDDEHELLAESVLEVASVAPVAAVAPVAPVNVAPLRASGAAKTRAFQASAETRTVLDPPRSTGLASPHGTTRAVSAACAHTPSASAAARSERRCRP